MILEKMKSCLWKLELGYRTHGFIRLLDARRKITCCSLLIGFFHKLTSIQVVGSKMLHFTCSSTAAITLCSGELWVISYHWQRCWAEEAISIWHWSKQKLARLTQVKHKGREAWHTIFTTYIRSTGGNLYYWLINIFIKKVHETKNTNTY